MRCGWSIERGVVAVLAAFVLCLGFGAAGVANAQEMTSGLVFPLNAQHNHAPGIVECANGDLIVSWYRGSGERTADDVVVLGSRLLKGSDTWSEPFLMADRKGFPDCNTAMMIDAEQRLWLFWPTIIANSWESAITNYRVSSDYLEAGAPKWEKEGLILLKPNDFSEQGNRLLDELVSKYQPQMTERLEKSIQSVRTRLGDKLYQRLGWQPRCKPTVLPSGRILLPLYTDTYSVSIMAISDDQGETWYASEPLIGFGNIQPAVVRRDDGTLVAYMRDNGPGNRVQVCESADDGVSWGAVEGCELLNPGAGLDAVRLQNGHWVLVYNDLLDGRNQLAVSISQDEGRSWSLTRHLEKQPAGAYHYPVVIQGADGRIHVVYSYFVEEGKSMKHAAFDETWVTAAP